MSNNNLVVLPLTRENIEAAFQTKFLFFTGKGGVGKTSIASASAVTLAQKGRRVLLVSTDPASNLDETFGVRLTNHPQLIPDVPGLSALNIDPEAAAEAYRQRVIAPLLGAVPEIEIAGLKEQLSGACTTEIAAFDEFATLISDDAIAPQYDTIIFDTAPTGHTIRLLSLPKAWTDFFSLNERGASCLGPHSALKNQEQRFSLAFNALKSPHRTTVVLVARPDHLSIEEAGRTAFDLKELQLENQVLVLNGFFTAASSDDLLASALKKKSENILKQLPPNLQNIPHYQVPLKSFNTVGLTALKKLLEPEATSFRETPSIPSPMEIHSTLSLKALAKEISDQDHGLVLVMGKGGVGKTTIASALAVSIAKQGKSVHLTTTDPAAHLAQTLVDTLPDLTVSRIDPKEETRRYVEKVLAAKGQNLDEDGIALLREDLASPCTEEVAVFHAFAKVVFEARRSIVILDTAPTGHTLLLLDAAGSYHREMLKKLEQSAPGKLITPLMMLQDAEKSKVLLVTLAEDTPISEAAALQVDLRRASIEPFGWVVNRSLVASSTRDPLLLKRAAAERLQLRRIQENYSKRVAILPYLPEDPVGIDRLEELLNQEL